MRSPGPQHLSSRVSFCLPGAERCAFGRFHRDCRRHLSGDIFLTVWQNKNENTKPDGRSDATTNGRTEQTGTERRSGAERSHGERTDGEDRNGATERSGAETRGTDGATERSRGFWNGRTENGSAHAGASPFISERLSSTAMNSDVPYLGPLNCDTSQILNPELPTFQTLNLC